MKYFDIKNILVSLKGLFASIVTMLVILLAYIAGSFISHDKPVIMLIVSLSILVLHLLTWGYFVRKWYGWK